MVSPPEIVAINEILDYVEDSDPIPLPVDLYNAILIQR